MNTGQQQLLITQLDKKIATIKTVGSIGIPGEGWIYSIRTALKMSLRQLGNRLKITAQGAKNFESREKEGSITLKNMSEIANALEMQFVYGFIPKQEASLEKIIEKRAFEIATQIVLKTSNTMKLEDQENSKARLQKAIEEKAAQIKAEMPRYLWD